MAAIYLAILGTGVIVGGVAFLVGKCADLLADLLYEVRCLRAELRGEARGEG